MNASQSDRNPHTMTRREAIRTMAGAALGGVGALTMTSAQRSDA